MASLETRLTFLGSRSSKADAYEEEVEEADLEGGGWLRVVVLEEP